MATETKTYQIPITKVFFAQEELRAIQLPLESGWVVQGPFVKEFEDKFATFTKSTHAIATSNCTTALHISVAALGLKPGTGKHRRATGENDGKYK